MNKDTILKSDIKEIIRALRNDIKYELELQESAEKDNDMTEEDRRTLELLSRGTIKGIEWAIRNLELNI